MGEIKISAPNYTLNFICLANSRKTSGRCIAGKVVSGPDLGKWIRPVSDRATGEISEEDRRFKNGMYPVLGDIILVPMKKQSHHPYQLENHLIDDRFYWSRKSQSDWQAILPFIDVVPAALWENLSSSTSGKNDRVDVTRATAAVIAFGGSLALIQISDLRIQVSVEGAEYNNAKRKVRGDFTHNGDDYCMAITDPKIEATYFARDDGDYEIGDAVICISLGDAYNGFAYKLIAAVFIPNVL